MRKFVPILLTAVVLAIDPTPAHAAPQDVRFRIQQVNGQKGQARFIEFILFNRCRNAGMDAWGDQCPHTRGRWIPISDNQLFNRRGRFCVYARWAAGEHRGTFTMPSNGEPLTYQITMDGSLKGTC